MKKLELKNALLDKLSEMLLPFEFVLVRRMDWFKRKEGSTTLVYQLAFYKSGLGYTVAPAIAVRLEEVERIFHLVSGYEPQYQKSSSTINPTIEELVKAKAGYEYGLYTPEDINLVAEKLFDVFKKIALPFLETHSSLASIDGFLNDVPKNYTVSLREYRGIIVAKLNKRENYEQLAEIYKHSLDSYYLADYERLLTILAEL
jgi:hypothetical protein